MTMTPALAAMLVVLAGMRDSAPAGSKDVCVSIGAIDRGRNCGSSDSIQVEVTNQCGVKVRGDVIFNQPSGDPVRSNIVLGSGDRLTLWTCHSNGQVLKDFAPEK